MYVQRFGKNNGNMGVSGSVAYMFDSTAVIGLEGKTADEVLEILMEADIDARDILEEEEAVIIYAEPDQFFATQEALKVSGRRRIYSSRAFYVASNRSDFNWRRCSEV